MEKTPFLSIIIPAYNEGERLPKTLPQVADFVASQDYSSEVIIVNNNSNDDTRAVATAFASDFPFIVSWTSYSKARELP